MCVCKGRSRFSPRCRTGSGEEGESGESAELTSDEEDMVGRCTSLSTFQKSLRLRHRSGASKLTKVSAFTFEWGGGGTMREGARWLISNALGGGVDPTPNSCSLTMGWGENRICSVFPSFAGTLFVRWMEVPRSKRRRFKGSKGPATELVQS